MTIIEDGHHLLDSWILCNARQCHVLLRNAGKPKVAVDPEEGEELGYEEPIETKWEKEERAPTKKMKHLGDPRNASGRKRPSLRSMRRESQSMERAIPLMITLEGVIPLTNPAYNPAIPQTFLEQIFTDKVEIGNGQFGKVFKVKSKSSSELYALKVSLKKSPQSVTYYYKEADMYLRVPAHQNLLRCFGAWVDNELVHIQTELCKTDLENYSKNGLSEKKVLKIFKELVSAVGQLHKHGWIHNDIKPDNIFLTDDNVCKLGDYGLMCRTDSGERVEGDARYLAPEVLMGCSSKASDVFSLGVTILEIATGLYIPGGSGKTARAIRTGTLPDQFFREVSMDLRGLLLQMIDRDPNMRPTCDELLEHPLLKVKFIGEIQVEITVKTDTFRDFISASSFSNVGQSRRSKDQNNNDTAGSFRSPSESPPAKILRGLAHNTPVRSPVGVQPNCFNTPVACKGSPFGSPIALRINQERTPQSRFLRKPIRNPLASPSEPVTENSQSRTPTSIPWMRNSPMQDRRTSS